MTSPAIISKPFDGRFDLSNPRGTMYGKMTQTKNLGFVAIGGVPGGWALVTIVANGDAINVPATWLLYGGDAISIVAGNTNHIQVFYKDADTIYYTNKVVTP